MKLPRAHTSAFIVSLALATQAACAADAKAPAAGDDIQAQLAAARARLQQAAREVAELSAQAADNLHERFVFRTGAPHAVIGLQLDARGGKDGAHVLEVSPGGPAAEAGVRKGDVIVAIDGVKIAGEDPGREIVEHMEHVSPGSKVKLTLAREGGKTQDIEVTARQSRGFDFAFQTPPMPPMPGAPPAPPAVVVGPTIAFGPWGDLNYMRALRDELGGMELASLTPALGQYFGTDKGVLVLRAPQSDAFHLQDGDVILAIDGREPKDGSHATRILRSYQPGEKITLKIMRQRKATSLDVTLPESRPRQQLERQREEQRQQRDEAREHANEARQRLNDARRRSEEVQT